jgi:hypothetical protein
MGDEQGYDDQFNDGLFQATLNNSGLSRPHKWPKSVSEMRHHTTYGFQGMSSDQDTAHSDYMGRRGATERPYQPPAPYYNHPQYKNHSRNGWTWMNSGSS